MTYEELNEMVKDWQNVGNLRVATENGNTSLHSDTGITPTLARNIIVSVWNELPRLFEEVRVLVDDHERMSAFLRVIQQISTDSMRCTSRMMRIADWRQGLPEYMVREMTEPDIAKMLNGEEPGESE
nr:MAG TPA: RcdA BINDING [Caudoviricetes sp.]